MKDIAKLYEELRSIIDGGSESFTHEDAVQYLKDKLAQPEQECICSQGQCCRVCDPDVANGFEQTEQEPVAWCSQFEHSCVQPPRRKPLTDEQIKDCLDAADQMYCERDGNKEVFKARAIEAEHGIKGEA